MRPINETKFQIMKPAVAPGYFHRLGHLGGSRNCQFPEIILRAPVSLEPGMFRSFRPSFSCRNMWNMHLQPLSHPATQPSRSEIKCGTHVASVIYVTVNSCCNFRPVGVTKLTKGGSQVFATWFPCRSTIAGFLQQPLSVCKCLIIMYVCQMHTISLYLVQCP